MLVVVVTNESISLSVEMKRYRVVESMRGNKHYEKQNKTIYIQYIFFPWRKIAWRFQFTHVIKFFVFFIYFIFFSSLLIFEFFFFPFHILTTTPSLIEILIIIVNEVPNAHLSHISLTLPSHPSHTLPLLPPSSFLPFLILNESNFVNFRRWLLNQ